MPSVAVKLYSVYFKLVLKHKLQSQIQTLTNQHSDPNPTSSSSSSSSSSFGITSRPDESTAPANPSFSDGVATKDIHIDPLTSLSIRIFLPDSSLKSNHHHHHHLDPAPRRRSYGGSTATAADLPNPRRSSYAQELPAAGTYRGYSPAADRSVRKLPVVLQFHGGAFVSGSNVSVANDLFCRRIAKLLDVVVIAVGYRLAPESRWPAAFEDGMKVLNWLGKQANLAECTKSSGGGGKEERRSESSQRIVDAFGAASVEPWLAAHGDPTR